MRSTVVRTMSILPRLHFFIISVIVVLLITILFILFLVIILVVFLTIIFVVFLAIIFVVFRVDILFIIFLCTVMLGKPQSLAGICQLVLRTSRLSLPPCLPLIERCNLLLLPGRITALLPFLVLQRFAE